MHISDGILSLPVLGCGIITTIGGISIGLRKLDYEKIPEAAIFASTFFVISLIHFPIGLTSVHLVLNGLIGLLFGLSSFPIIFIGLLLQTLLFGHGGLLALGVNTMNIAIPSICVHYIFKFLITKIKENKILFLIGFGAGSISFMLSIVMTFFSLYFSAPEKFQLTSLLVVITHLPLLILEGVIVGIAIVYLKKMKPEILNNEN